MFVKVFGKTSLWSYLGAITILLLAVLWHQGVINESVPFSGNLTRTTIIGVLALCSLLAVDWAVRTQSLDQKNSYHLLVFALLFWVLPISQWDIWLWIALLFFWLALMQLMRSDGKTRTLERAFNAGFWLFFAVLFRADFIYFILTIWFMFNFKGQLSYKNALITILPVLCIAMVWMMLYFLIPGFPPFKMELYSSVNYPFLWYDQLLDNSGYIIIALSTFFFVLKHLRGLIHTNNDQKVKIYNMIVIVISSVLIILLSGAGNLVSWISFLMAIAALSNQFFDSFKRKWLVEFLFLIHFSVVFKDQIQSLLAIT